MGWSHISVFHFMWKNTRNGFMYHWLHTNVDRMRKERQQMRLQCSLIANRFNRIHLFHAQMSSSKRKLTNGYGDVGKNEYTRLIDRFSWTDLSRWTVWSQCSRHNMRSLILFLMNFLSIFASWFTSLFWPHNIWSHSHRTAPQTVLSMEIY